MSAQFVPPQRVPVATAALALGAQIGPFTVLQVLHEGPHGYVYLTRDQTQGLTRVLKELMPRKHAVRHPDGDVLPLEAGDSIAVAEARLAFTEEANALAAVEQPGLVRVLGLLSMHHTLYRVMPLYDGVTLERQCRGRGAAPTVKWVAGIVDDLLAALEALHAQGHAHGCVRPDQVLVSDTQRATLLGFGSVARALDDDAAAPPWRAPEGEGTDRHFPSSQASDMHALAATAWFAATGGVPPHGQLAAPVDSPDDAPQLRRGLVEAIESGLAMRGPERPRTVAEFRHLLQGRPWVRAAPAEPAPPRAHAATLPDTVNTSAPPIAVAEGAAAAPVAPVATTPLSGVGDVGPIAPVRVARAMLAAKVAARRTHAEPSMALSQPRPPPFDVSLAPAQSEEATAVSTATGVESERIEPSWLDAPSAAARVPSGAALEALGEPPRAEGVAANSPPRPRRAAVQAMALAALALVGAGVALTRWDSSSPEAGLSMASSPRDPERSGQAVALSVPTAPAVVRDATGVPPSAQAVVSPAPAVTITPPAQAAEAAAAPAAVAAAPAPRVPAMRSPAALCGHRTQFSRVYCMQQQCAKPALRYHRQCIEMRRNG